MFISKITNWLRLRRSYVILDGIDSSMTFSKNLFRHIKELSNDDAAPKVFVFYIPSTQKYGFMVDPNIEQPTQLADIQYNSKYKCIGFETLNPTVAKIFYDYGIEGIDKPCKLSVSVHSTPDKQIYYQIERPHEKFTRNSTSLRRYL